MSEQKETKACPFCGEEILAVAVKCKHCQTDLKNNDDTKTNKINQKIEIVTKPRDALDIVTLIIKVVVYMGLLVLGIFFLMGFIYGLSGGGKSESTPAAPSSLENKPAVLPKADEPKNAAYYENLCTKNQADACATVGTMYYEGLTGVKKDNTKASHFYKKACDGGSAIGCMTLGIMYKVGEVEEKDYDKSKDYPKSFELFKKAFELFTKACDGGNADGCAQLGFMYFNALYVRENDAKASELFKKSCNGGSSEGCQQLELVRRLNK